MHSSNASRAKAAHLNHNPVFYTLVGEIVIMVRTEDSVVPIQALYAANNIVV